MSKRPQGTTKRATPTASGKAVRAARMKLMMSGAALARAIGASQSHLSNFEVGHSRISPEMAREVERVLKMKPLSVAGSSSAVSAARAAKSGNPTKKAPKTKKARAADPANTATAAMPERAFDMEWVVRRKAPKTKKAHAAEPANIVTAATPERAFDMERVARRKAEVALAEQRARYEHALGMLDEAERIAHPKDRASLAALLAGLQEDIPEIGVHSISVSSGEIAIVCYDPIVSKK